jgi:hypothetical protein
VLRQHEPGKKRSCLLISTPWWTHFETELRYSLMQRLARFMDNRRRLDLQIPRAHTRCVQTTPRGGGRERVSEMIAVGRVNQCVRFQNVSERGSFATRRLENADSNHVVTVLGKLVHNPLNCLFGHQLGCLGVSPQASRRFADRKTLNSVVGLLRINHPRICHFDTLTDHDAGVRVCATQADDRGPTRVRREPEGRDTGSGEHVAPDLPVVDSSVIGSGRRTPIAHRTPG